MQTVRRSLFSQSVIVLPWSRMLLPLACTTRALIWSYKERTQKQPFSCFFPDLLDCFLFAYKAVFNHETRLSISQISPHHVGEWVCVVGSGSGSLTLLPRHSRPGTVITILLIPKEQNRGREFASGTPLPIFFNHIFGPSVVIPARETQIRAPKPQSLHG